MEWKLETNQSNLIQEPSKPFPFSQSRNFGHFHGRELTFVGRFGGSKFVWPVTLKKTKRETTLSLQEIRFSSGSHCFVYFTEDRCVTMCTHNQEKLFLSLEHFLTPISE
jgi:hypothetical protein